MKKKNKETTGKLPDKKEIWILVGMLPVLFLIMIGMYFGLTKLSKEYSRVCTFMGKLWISEAQMTSTIPEGCYTYEQLAQLKYNEELKLENNTENSD